MSKKKFLIHVSPRANRESILRLGLVPHYSPLPNHTRRFRKRKGWLKVIYLCRVTKGTLPKFAQDFAYWKVWGSPRNKLLHRFHKGPRKKANPSPAIHDRLRLNPIEFDVYQIRPKGIGTDFYSLLHSQNTTGGHSTLGPSFANMDENYCHIDRPTVIVGKPVPPDCLRLVGRVETFSEGSRVKALFHPLAPKEKKKGNQR